MAHLCDLQAAVAGLYGLFRREVRIRRYLIPKGMLLDLLSVASADFGPDAFFRIASEIFESSDIKLLDFYCLTVYLGINNV